MTLPSPFILTYHLISIWRRTEAFPHSPRPASSLYGGHFWSHRRVDRERGVPSWLLRAFWERFPRTHQARRRETVRMLTNIMLSIIFKVGTFIILCKLINCAMSATVPSAGTVKWLFERGDVQMHIDCEPYPNGWLHRVKRFTTIIVLRKSQYGGWPPKLLVKYQEAAVEMILPGFIINIVGTLNICLAVYLTISGNRFRHSSIN